MENRNLKQKRYTEEFKKEAVRYIVLEGESVASVAERLGVNANLLYNWKKVYLEQCGSESAGKDQPSLKDVVAENERLRKELRREQRTNEILKKTVGFFAKDEL
ncbi:transposase [Puniceicoccaceae bacterium K14]|nr:transposase [Puniceicoccaceae bacterium K14]